MLALEERRATLQAELDALHSQLNDLKGRLVTRPAPAALSLPAAAIPSPRPKAKRGKRGFLKESILAALASAGAAGIKVKELATTLGTKPVNVHSWFHSALKKDKSIVKIKGGHYRLGSSSPTTAAPAVAKTSKKSSRRKGTKRGALTAAIVGELKAAGSKGITVTDLAKKLGAPYRNIYIWFATTGKKQAGLKKLAPATYRLS
jgi:hypothetical protein